MFKITKNTYPKNSIGRHQIGTICEWIIERGHLILKKCDTTGNIIEPDYTKENGKTIDINSILSHGQIYSLDGNLLSGKKEPDRVGIVAKYIKNGWFLELELTK